MCNINPAKTADGVDTCCLQIVVKRVIDVMPLQPQHTTSHGETKPAQLREEPQLLRLWNRFYSMYVWLYVSTQRYSVIYLQGSFKDPFDLWEHYLLHQPPPHPTPPPTSGPQHMVWWKILEKEKHVSRGAAAWCRPVTAAVSMTSHLLTTGGLLNIALVEQGFHRDWCWRRWSIAWPWSIKSKGDHKSSSMRITLVSYSCYPVRILLFYVLNWWPFTLPVVPFLHALLITILIHRGKTSVN